MLPSHDLCCIFCYLTPVSFSQHRCGKEILGRLSLSKRVLGFPPLHLDREDYGIPIDSMGVRVTIFSSISLVYL